MVKVCGDGQVMCTSAKFVVPTDCEGRVRRWQSNLHKRKGGDFVALLLLMLFAKKGDSTKWEKEN